MGKQIPTCIHKGKKDLLEYLLEKDYGLVARMRVNELTEFAYADKKDDLTEMFLKQNIIYVTTKDLIKGLIIITTDNGNKYLKHTNKLIELWFSRIIVEKNRIIRGRVYFGNRVDQLIDEEAKACNEIYKDVVKWVKKNVPYRPDEKVTDPAKPVYKAYIEDYIYDLVENQGFKIL